MEHALPRTYPEPSTRPPIRPSPASRGPRWAPWPGPLPAGLLGGIALVFAGCTRDDPEHATPEPPPQERPVTAGVVAADHGLASEAGAEILREGGNAVDAAVAAALAAGVVQPGGSGLGGGGFALVAPAGEKPTVVDFREVAPAAATADLFLDDGGSVVPEASTYGGLAVAVPAEPLGLAEMHRRWGRLDLERIIAPAVHLAEEGFPVGEHLAEQAADWADEHGTALFPQLFQDVEGPPAADRPVRRPRLADTLRRWAAGGGRALHEGDLAADLVRAVKEAGGILTVEDLESYEVRIREPLAISWRDYTVYAMPPPSSGGLVMLQALEVIEHWDLQRGQLDDPETVRRIVETLEHGFADRARWMGDPDFVDVPVDRLLSAQRVDAVNDAVLALADPCGTAEPDRYGLPLHNGEDAGTQHISVMDGEGMAVSLTTTINTDFGSGVVAPGSGVLLNNEMDDFVAAPGVPNEYGLVGNERNAVAPGRRPLSSMSPTIVYGPASSSGDAAPTGSVGEPVLVVGASGGPFIISSTLQVLLDLLVDGAYPQDAVEAPRYHHQWMPNRVFLDTGAPEAWEQKLESCGHQVKRMAFYSAVQVAMKRHGGIFAGACDPRKGGRPSSVGPPPPAEAPQP